MGRRKNCDPQKINPPTKIQKYYWNNGPSNITKNSPKLFFKMILKIVITLMKSLCKNRVGRVQSNAISKIKDYEIEQSNLCSKR